MRTLIREIVPSSPSPAGREATQSPRSESCRVGLFLDGRIGRRWCHHELRLTPSEPDLDRAGGQLDRDLFRRGRQRVLDREPDGGIQRLGEASRELSRLLTARLGGGVELRVDTLDERSEFHGSIMAS